MARVGALIRRSSGATRVEWWAPGDDGDLELVAATGDGRGPRQEIPLGRGGMLAVLGGCLDSRLASALAPLGPILRRRSAEERLAQTAIQLARRNEALEDFAALVAHELKAPLEAALVAPGASRSLEQALDLVDALLEAAQHEASERTFASAAECLAEAVQDLRADVEITAELPTTLPLPPEPLRVVLRNLLANAVAAGARNIHVTVVQSSRSWRLLVDDDGVGLGDVDRYAAGSGLGLSLCRRIAARFGGALELAPRPSGGTRATLALSEVTQ
jgi:signal transduction histidine kinase